MALSEAIIATYMTIHMARSPGSHSERMLLLARSCRREPKSCGCGFQATKARSFCPTSLLLLATGHCGLNNGASVTRGGRAATLKAPAGFRRIQARAKDRLNPSRQAG